MTHFSKQKIEWNMCGVMLQTPKTCMLNILTKTLLRIFLAPVLSVRSRSVSGASTGLSSSPLSSPRVSDFRSILTCGETALTITQHTVTQVILLSS